MLGFVGGDAETRSTKDVGVQSVHSFRTQGRERFVLEAGLERSSYGRAGWLASYSQISIAAALASSSNNFFCNISTSA
jgi:hypothetical protein